jgi:ABC-2 type transport system ATP-binding protein
MKTENILIKAQGLRKCYGATTALDGVTFRVPEGEVFAYLGPNGAGKTTTINILCGLLQRDDGEVTIGGLDINREPVEVKQRIGVVPEESNLYPELSCRRNLEYIAELFGLPRSSRRARTDFLLEAFRLGDKATSPFRSLSRGMKRRLTVAAALIHSPEGFFSSGSDRFRNGKGSLRGHDFDELFPVPYPFCQWGFYSRRGVPQLDQTLSDGLTLDLHCGVA